eukprot:g2380.t1
MGCAQSSPSAASAPTTSGVDGGGGGSSSSGNGNRRRGSREAVDESVSAVALLSSFVPHHVRLFLQTRKPQLTEEAFDPQMPGNFRVCGAAVMLCDVSGFTALTELLAAQSDGHEGAEKLTAILNAFYTKVVAVIEHFGGDVLKFAGDAAIAMFEQDGEQGVDLSGAIMRAVLCSRDIIDLVRDYPEVGVGNDMMKLGVHIGIGSGSVTNMAIGGRLGRWEAVSVGRPLLQLDSVVHETEKGEIGLSPEAWAEVQNWVLVEDIEGSHRDNKLVVGVQQQDPIAGEHKRETNDDQQQAPTGGAQQLWTRRSTSLSASTAAGGAGTSHSQSLKVARGSDVTTILESLKRFCPGAVLSGLREHESGELLSGMLNELRRGMSIVFASFPGMTFDDAPGASVKELHTILLDMQEVCFLLEGSFNKLLMDDKGVLMVWAMGLPPFSHADDAVRALKFALISHNKQKARGRKMAAGVATGTVFCGIVGSRGSRCEYTLMGDSVNLAARLMQHSVPSGVTCDLATQIQVDATGAAGVDLAELPPTKVKGKSEPLRIFAAKLADARSQRSPSGKLMLHRRARSGSAGSGGGAGGSGSYPAASNSPRSIGSPLHGGLSDPNSPLSPLSASGSGGSRGPETPPAVPSQEPLGGGPPNKEGGLLSPAGASQLSATLPANLRAVTLDASIKDIFVGRQDVMQTVDGILGKLARWAPPSADAHEHGSDISSGRAPPRERVVLLKAPEGRGKSSVLNEIYLLVESKSKHGDDTRQRLGQAMHTESGRVINAAVPVDGDGQKSQNGLLDIDDLNLQLDDEKEQQAALVAVGELGDVQEEDEEDEEEEGEEQETGGDDDQRQNVAATKQGPNGANEEAAASSTYDEEHREASGDQQEQHTEAAVAAAPTPDSNNEDHAGAADATVASSNAAPAIVHTTVDGGMASPALSGIDTVAPHEDSNEDRHHHPPGVVQQRLFGRPFHLFFGSAGSTETRVPFFAWCPVFADLFQILDADDLFNQHMRQEEVVQKVQAFCSKLTVPAGRAADYWDERVPLLEAVIAGFRPNDSLFSASLHGEKRQEATVEYLWSLLDATSATRAVVILLDNGQWLDAASCELLTRVMSRSPGILTILATRPVQDPSVQQRRKKRAGSLESRNRSRSRSKSRGGSLGGGTPHGATATSESKDNSKEDPGDGDGDGDGDGSRGGDSNAFAERLRRLSTDVLMFKFMHELHRASINGPFEGVPEEKQFVRLLELPLLTDEEMTDLILRDLGVVTMPNVPLRAIKSKAQGNPNLAKLLAKSILDHGLLKVEVGTQGERTLVFADNAGSSGFSDKMQLSDDISKIMMMEVDGLPPEQKTILKVASVIGAQFTLDEVCAICPADYLDGCVGCIQELCAHRIIRKVPTLRDVVYNLLSFEKKRHFHALYAENIERAHRGHLSSHFSQLAFHFSRADNWDKAALYLDKAATKAHRHGNVADEAQMYGELSEIVDKQKKSGKRTSLFMKKNEAKWKRRG